MNVIEKLKKYLKAEMKRLDEEYEEYCRTNATPNLITCYYYEQTEKILNKLEELEDEGE